ncbi:hypothetical protein N9W21_04725 [Shewanella sp.]|nr:hypothetical protein [Shewanella sp.]
MRWTLPNAATMRQTDLELFRYKSNAQHDITIDLAKTVFQVLAMIADTKTSYNKRLSRTQLLGNTAPCIIVMKACCSSHYWDVLLCH